MLLWKTGNYFKRDLNLVIVCVKNQSTVLMSGIFLTQIKEGSCSMLTRIRVVKRAVEPFTLLRSNFLPKQQIWICSGFGSAWFWVDFFQCGVFGWVVCWDFCLYFGGGCLFVFMYWSSLSELQFLPQTRKSEVSHISAASPVPQHISSPITVPVVLLSLLASPTQRSG